MKRTVGKRTAGILSIVMGGLYALAGLLLLFALSILTSVGLEAGLQAEFNAAMNTVRLLTFVILGFGVASIVIGSLFCKSKKQKGLAIALIVMNAVLIGLSIYSAAVTGGDALANGGFEGSFSSGIIGYVISALIIVFCAIHIAMADKVMIEDKQSA